MPAKKLVKILLSSACVIFLFLAAYTVHAKYSYGDSDSNLDIVVPKTGIEKVGITVVVGRIIKAALFLVGIIFFILIVYAGIKWMTSRGKEDNIQAAQDSILRAVIGLVIAVSAYGITFFVTNRIINAQKGAALLELNAVGDVAGKCCVSPIITEILTIETATAYFYSIVTSYEKCQESSEDTQEEQGWGFYPEVINSVKCKEVMDCWDDECTGFCDTSEEKKERDDCVKVVLE